MRRSVWILSVVCALSMAGCAHRGGGELPMPKAPVQARYVVRGGDSWQRISELYFGGPSEAERLAKDNGSTVQPGQPLAGTTIVISIPPDKVDQVRRVKASRGAYNEGTQLFEQGRNIDALEAYETALEVAPELVDARYNAGLALLRLDRAPEAIDYLDEVVRLRPDDKDATYALASAYFHQEDYAHAVELLEGAVILDPGFLRARYTLAFALERLGRGAEAKAAWQSYLELDDSSAWADEARAHLEAPS